VTEWLGLLARLVVGGVWIVAGALKLPDPAQSVDAVRAYELLPGALIRPVGLMLPAVEIVVGLCLVLGLLTRAAALASAVLFVLFIVGIASAWARGINIDCGCFGGGGYEPDAQSKYPGEIARDVALLLASLFLVWKPVTRLALDAMLFRRTPQPEGL
jgi:uncharacterized membrane protein YphA (DoxX/SURF4 family)